MAVAIRAYNKLLRKHSGSGGLCIILWLTSHSAGQLNCRFYKMSSNVYFLILSANAYKQHTQRPMVDSPFSMVCRTIVDLPAVPFKLAHLLGLAGSVVDKLNPTDDAQGKDKGK